MNYDGTGAAATAGIGGTLAMTGAPGLLWIALAAFAMICLGSAIWRMTPRSEDDEMDDETNTV